MLLSSSGSSQIIYWKWYEAAGQSDFRAGLKNMQELKIKHTYLATVIVLFFNANPMSRDTGRACSRGWYVRYCSLFAHRDEASMKPCHETQTS